jgi:hypothetical protein
MTRSSQSVTPLGMDPSIGTIHLQLANEASA